MILFYCIIPYHFITINYLDKNLNSGTKVYIICE